VLSPLRYLGGRYQYPEALIDDLDADPFVGATIDDAPAR
jgi:hypothetical protein